jgi:hypothetical protein
MNGNTATGAARAAAQLEPSGAAESGPSGAAAAHLYWANFSNGTVAQGSLNGTHAKTIVKHQYARTGWRSVPGATAVGAKADGPTALAAAALTRQIRLAAARRVTCYAPDLAVAIQS